MQMFLQFYGDSCKRVPGRGELMLPAVRAAGLRQHDDADEALQPLVWIAGARHDLSLQRPTPCSGAQAAENLATCLSFAKYQY